MCNLSCYFCGTNVCYQWPSVPVPPGLAVSWRDRPQYVLDQLLCPAPARLPPRTLALCRKVRHGTCPASGRSCTGQTFMFKHHLLNHRFQSVEKILVSRILKMFWETCFNVLFCPDKRQNQIETCYFALVPIQTVWVQQETFNRTEPLFNMVGSFPGE